MIELGTAAVLFLAPYLKDAGTEIASKAGEAAAEGVHRLVDSIRRKLASSGPEAQQAFDELQRQPDNAERQDALATVLTSEAEQDEAFATDLARLVRELTEEPTLTSFLTHIYGQAKVGQILNIHQAGNLSFGDVRFDGHGE